MSNTLLRMETSFGQVDIELFDQRARMTVMNFLKYVNAGFYNGLIFHRVIPDFMVQGGGFTPQMQEKQALYPPIHNEAVKSGIKNRRGTLAMARTSNPHSATAQFFINLVDNQFLDPNPQNPHGYAAFGKVTGGMDVVDKIAKVQTGSRGGHDNVPLQPVLINKIYVTGQK